MQDSDKSTPTLLSEIEKMALYIMNAKKEIAAMAPDTKEGGENQVNVASIELNEVIKATEDATNRIMDAAEAIQTIADSLDNASPAKQQLSNHAEDLIQACTFQDITGQRIRKVLRMHEHIEARIGNLVKIFGGALPEGYTLKNLPAGTTARPDEALMNGPQLSQNAPSQDDIDKLFASL